MRHASSLRRTTSPNRLHLALGVWLAMSAVAMASDAASAKSSFSTFCTPCHGEAGLGNGTAGQTLKTPPANFTDCSRMLKEDDDKLFRVIKEGGGSNGLSDDMQPWGNAFEDEEIRALVAYVRTFCEQ
jgi:mono/diheme cytochrome c family protein